MTAAPEAAPELAFEAPAREPDETLVVDVDGFEGPLDLLLKLARDQKVDLTRISVLALAEQYLAFIEAARRLRLEIAADYLVMAAWLAYLKSRLLIPVEEAEDDEPSGDELAAVLAARLKHLEAIREAGRRLMALPRLGIDIFPRGMPEAETVNTETQWDARLYDLLSAYAALRLRNVANTMHVRQRTVLTLQDARERLMQLIGSATHWATLDSYLVEYLVRPEMRATARASALSASLELVREGEVELKQKEPFAPLYVRRRLKEGMALKEAANG
jgi:segregation and condensation protein A